MQMVYWYLVYTKYQKVVGKKGACDVEFSYLAIDGAAYIRKNSDMLLIYSFPFYYIYDVLKTLYLLGRQKTVSNVCFLKTKRQWQLQPFPCRYSS